MKKTTQNKDKSIANPISLINVLCYISNPSFNPSISQSSNYLIFENFSLNPFLLSSKIPAL